MRSFPTVACARLVLRVFCSSGCVPLVVLVGRPAARSASWPLWTRGTVTSLSVAYLAGFTGGSAPRAVFLSLSSGPRCAASWLVWIRSTVMWVLLGGFVPVVCNNRCFWFRSAENCGFSAVAFLHHGCRHLLRGSEAHPHGPCDHGDSPVVRGSGDRCPCWWFDGAETVVIRSCSSSKIVDFLFVPQRQLPMVPPFRKTIEFLHLQYVDWWSMPLLCRSFSMPVVA